MRHRQVWIKVNAPVDKGVQDLVTALSSFPRLQTIESCQGGKRGAWVCFLYGTYWKHPWEELADFVLGFLGPRLAHYIGDRATIALRITSFGYVQGEITVRLGALKETTKALRKILCEF